MTSPPVTPPVARPTDPLPRNFWLLWLARTVSLLGTEGHQVALALTVQQLTGSTTVMGLVLMAASIPGTLLGPVGGVLADRHSRVRIVVACDAISGLAVLLLAAVLVFARRAVPVVVGALAVAAVVLGIVRGFFGPAQSALVPDLVPRGRLVAANSLLASSRQAVALLGQAAGGVLFTAIGAPLLFVVDGVTYLASAGCQALIRPPRRDPPASPPTGGRAQLRAELRQGLAYVAARRGLRNVFMGAAVLNFFVRPYFVLLPFFVSDFLRASPKWYGFILAGFGLGSLGGYGLAAAVKPTGRARARAMWATWVGFAVALTLFGLVRAPAGALALAVVASALMGYFNINLAAVMQSMVPEDVRGRVFALLQLAMAGLSPLAMGLAGITADLAQRNVPAVYVVCGAAMVAFSLFLVRDRAVMAFLSEAAS